MTFWQIIGLLLVFSPALVVGVFVVRDAGWRVFVEIFGGVAVMLAVIALGSALFNGLLP